jgi:hypothetical protein
MEKGKEVKHELPPVQENKMEFTEIVYPKIKEEVKKVKKNNR